MEQMPATTMCSYGAELCWYQIVLLL